MNFDYIKNKKQYLPKGLCILSLFLIGVMIFKVVVFGVGYITLPGRIETAVAAFGQNDKNIEKSVSKRQEAVEKLKQKNMFIPPAPAPNPPVCTGVLGDTAIINGQGYKVGQEVGGAKIVAIGPTEVTILWQEKEMKLPAFGAGKIAPSGPPAPTQKPMPAGPGNTPPPMPARPPGPQGNPFNMTEEQMRQMREKVMKMSPEERQKFIAEQRAKMNR
jgi:hypothetical protein